MTTPAKRLTSLLLTASLLGPYSLSALAVGPDDPEPAFARKFCAERKSPADNIAYYSNGSIRADIGCALGGGYLSAQFYNEQGRLTRSEHPAPGLPGQHDVEIYEYAAGSSRPARVKIYDANGNLLQTRDGEAHRPAGQEPGQIKPVDGDLWDHSDASPFGPRSSAENYVDICRTNAPYYQRFLLGEVKPLEFDVDKACDCIARRLGNEDPASAAGGQTPLEQVDAVAMYEPKGCICPNANPGSSLQKNCEQR